MRSSIRDWRLELERLEQILNRLGPDEVCCEDLSARQCVILRVLASREGTRLSHLATMVEISPSAMTRVIERLEKLGLVQRLHGKFPDGRATAVAITDQGRKTRDRIDCLMMDRTKEIVAGIPAHERPTLLHSLRLLNQAMERPGCCAVHPKTRKFGRTS